MSSLIELARFEKPYQAGLARLFLESHGLQAVVFDSHAHGYSEGALVDVRLMVLDEDLQDARRIMRDYKP